MADQLAKAPYPHAVAVRPTPHPRITVEAVATAHIASLARITGLLLPIRYPSSFYTATITDPVVASLSRVAVYHGDDKHGHDGCSDKVIGGIRCRLEPVEDAEPAAANLYIQTLHLLSPYRGNGVATSLLHSLLYAASASPTAAQAPAPAVKTPLSDIVRHYNIRTVTAHVHETNDDALQWYLARGFQVQDGVIEGYYRRLKPSGARLVRLVLPGDDDDDDDNDCKQ